MSKPKGEDKMLSKLLIRGKQKLAAERAAQKEADLKVDAGLDALFRRIVPKSLRRYAKVSRTDRAGADIVIELPFAAHRVERYVSFDGKTWKPQDDDLTTFWHAMEGDESLGCYDDLDKALARSMEKD